MDFLLKVLMTFWWLDWQCAGVEEMPIIFHCRRNQSILVSNHYLAKPPYNFNVASIRIVFIEYNFLIFTQNLSLGLKKKYFGWSIVCTLFYILTRINILRNTTLTSLSLSHGAINTVFFLGVVEHQGLLGHLEGFLLKTESQQFLFRLLFSF